MNSPNTSISKLTCHCVKQLFQIDTTYQTSYEAVLAVANFIKTSGYQVKGEMLDVFKELNLSEVQMKERERIEQEARHPKKHNKPGKHLSQTKQKILKAEKKLAAELKETEAELNKTAIYRKQTEILKLVIATYFRIMKNAASSDILPNALEGLAKFALLIDVGFIEDIMRVLEKLVSDPNLPTAVALNSIRTASLILTRAGSALSIDAKTFHNKLFAVLPLSTSNDKDFLLALTCTFHLFHRRHEVSTERIAAFMKRLISMSTCLPTNYSMAIYSLFRQTLIKYDKLRTLIENETLSTGIYHEYIDDPERCNAFATTGWELSLMHNHFNPTVAAYARHLTSGLTSMTGLDPAVSRLSYTDVHESYSSRVKIFNPKFLMPTLPPMRKTFENNTFLLDTPIATHSISEALDAVLQEDDDANGAFDEFFSKQRKDARILKLSRQRDRLAGLLYRWDLDKEAFKQTRASQSAQSKSNRKKKAHATKRLVKPGTIGFRK